MIIGRRRGDRGYWDKRREDRRGKFLGLRSRGGKSEALVSDRRSVVACEEGCVGSRVERPS